MAQFPCPPSEWLEYAIELVRTLNRQILSSQPHFVGMDIDAIYRSIAEQEATCRQLHLHCAGATLDGTGAYRDRRANPVAEDGYGKLLADFLKARHDLLQLTRTQQAFLRRSGRNGQIFLNALGVQNPTYTLAEITSNPEGMR